MSKYFLTSARLGFRSWTENDFEFALGLWGDIRVTKLFDARGQLSEQFVVEKDIC